MTDPTPYPTRCQLFSVKFNRTLRCARVASEVGAAGAWLLNIIASQEDVFWYSKAPDFWDSQLADELGGIDQKTLARIRSKCVKAGWLHYDQGRKGKAGRYFVIVPEWARSLMDKANPSAGFDVNFTGNPTQKDQPATCDGNIPSNPTDECDGNIPSNEGGQSDSPANFRGIRGENGSKVEQKRDESGTKVELSIPSSSTVSPSFSSSQDGKNWKEVEEGLRRLKVIMVRQSLEDAQENGFNPPQVLAIIEYLETTDHGLDNPAGAIVHRLKNADAVDWMANEKWPGSHRSGGGEDLDKMFHDAVQKCPVDNAALAANAETRAAQETAAVHVHEEKFGAALDAMPDDELLAWCAKLKASKTRLVRDAGVDALNNLEALGRSADKTRAALLVAMYRAQKSSA